MVDVRPALVLKDGEGHLRKGEGDLRRSRSIEVEGLLPWRMCDFSAKLHLHRHIFLHEARAKKVGNGLDGYALLAAHDGLHGH